MARSDPKYFDSKKVNVAVSFVTFLNAPESNTNLLQVYSPIFKSPNKRLNVVLLESAFELYWQFFKKTTTLSSDGPTPKK